MYTETTPSDNMRRIPHVLTADFFNVLFCTWTVFGSVFVLFLSELGLDKARIGFLVSLLPLCGLVALFAAPLAARVGLRRTFLTLWGMRKITISLLVVTPWVLQTHGLPAAFHWVAGIVFLFALCRALGETAYYPWIQEVIPPRIRGRFTAVQNMVTLIGQMLALGIAGYVVGHAAGLDRYMLLIVLGVICGLACVLFYSFMPGGAPRARSMGDSPHLSQMREAWADVNFRHFLMTIGLINFTGSAVYPFVPLFMKELVGIPPGRVVLLELWTSIGALLSCCVWGWASDRYGSKPVMVLNLGILVLLPVCWLLLPRQTHWSFAAAAFVALVSGWANTGWATGWNRYLFVNAVPAEKNTAYMAVFYAWMGLTGGTGPLISGRFVDWCAREPFRFIRDPYTPLLSIGLILLASGFYCALRVRNDAEVGTQELVRTLLKVRTTRPAESPRP